MRGNCAEVGVAWARRSAGDTAGCDLSTLCILNWDTTGFKNQQLAADSQQTQMQEWKLEEHQTEQPSPNKGDEVDAPLRSLVNTLQWSSLLMIFHFVHTTPEWLLLNSLDKISNWSSLWMANRYSSTWMRAVSPHSLCHLSNVRATGRFWEWADEQYAVG